VKTGAAETSENYGAYCSDRRFRHMCFLLDGYDFESCTFDECWFALRGQHFGLRNNDLGSMTLDCRFPDQHVRAGDIGGEMNRP